MRLLGSILIAITAITGCSKKEMDSVNTTSLPVSIPPVVTAPVNPADTVTYLALGDSYTIGQSVPQEQSYPYQLSALLKADKYRIGNPVIIARTGWTTGDLKTAIADAALKQKFTFVTLLIGVNNQYQHYDPDAYRTDFINLLNMALVYANGNKKRVFVLSIPDYSVTPYAEGSDRSQIRSQLNVYNDINQNESTKLGVNYLDIVSISRSAATDPTLLADDGLHPSGAMYKLWVNQLVAQVTASLNGN